jgi:hypothetical protein
MNDEFISHGRSGWLLKANDELSQVGVDVDLGIGGSDHGENDDDDHIRLGYGPAA